MKYTYILLITLCSCGVQDTGKPRAEVVSERNRLSDTLEHMRDSIGGPVLEDSTYIKLQKKFIKMELYLDSLDKIRTQ
jgi:hypothetical protein